MSDVVALVLAILVVVALFLAVVMIPLSRRAKGLRAAVEEEFGDAAIRVANANGLGLESRGRGQVRGNGWLILTREELRFRQWVPQRETTIPLGAVTAVGTERTWLGKWVGAKLLRVRWRTPEGGEDAMAWQVPELEEWLAALRSPPGPSSG